MAYLQNNSAFIPNGLTRYLPHSNQCDETNCSLTKRFGDAESCAQCPIYYDQRPVRFADRTICGGVYRSVSLNDELPNLPPNSYGTLAKRKREKVYSIYGGPISLQSTSSGTALRKKAGGEGTIDIRPHSFRATPVWSILKYHTQGGHNASSFQRLWTKSVVYFTSYFNACPPPPDKSVQVSCSAAWIGETWLCDEWNKIARGS